MQTAEQLPPGDRLPSDHPAPYDGPIDSPGAWYGSDLQERSEWKYVLSEQECAELLAATRAVRRLSDNIMDIGKEDFSYNQVYDLVENNLNNINRLLHAFRNK